MKNSVEIEKKLKLQKTKSNRVDVIITSLMILGVLSLFVVFSLTNNPQNVTDWFIVLFITLFATYPFVYVGGKVAHYIQERFTPLYVIVIEDGVRKAYGPVSLNSEQIYKDLLKPNFKLFRGNTFEKYGCTFAAIPFDESDFKAKKELNNLGIKTKNYFG